MPPIKLASLSHNEQVFLHAIMFAEGTLKLQDSKIPKEKQVSAYRIRFGYTEPHIDNNWQYPEPVNINGQIFTAAGAYQIIDSTWKSNKDKLGLTNFTPQAQNAVAIQLIKDAGAYDNVMKGQWEEAIRKCSTKWASFPYRADTSYWNTNGKALHIYGGTPQKARRMSDLLNYIESLKKNGFKLTETDDVSDSVSSSKSYLSIGLSLLIFGFIIYKFKSIKNAFS